MTNIFKDSRRDLRERAFQTLFALEFGGEALEQAHFAYTCLLYTSDAADEL